MSITTWTVLCVLLQEPARLSIAAPSNPPWVVVHRPESKPWSGIANPQLIVLPNGTYVAAYQHSGHRGSQLGTFVFRSRDRGITWTEAAKLTTPEDFDLFAVGETLYMMGLGGNFTSRVVIQRSEDEGSTWNASVDEKTGSSPQARLWACSSPVVLHGGRVWSAFRWAWVADAAMQYRFTIASAAQDANLLSPASWRWSPEWDASGSGCSACRGSTFLARENAPLAWLIRSESVHAVANVSEDGGSIGVSASPAWDLPKGTMGERFVHDPKTDSFVGLRYRLAPLPSEKPSRLGGNVVECVSSKDLLKWETLSTLIHDGEPKNEPQFCQADWAIDGDNLLVLLEHRELPKAAEDSDRAGNQVVLFLRVPAFRERTSASPPLWGPAEPK